MPRWPPDGAGADQVDHRIADDFNDRPGDATIALDPPLEGASCLRLAWVIEYHGRHDHIDRIGWLVDAYQTASARKRTTPRWKKMHIKHIAPVCARYVRLQAVNTNLKDRHFRDWDVPITEMSIFKVRHLRDRDVPIAEHPPSTTSVD